MAAPRIARSASVSDHHHHADPLKSQLHGLPLYPPSRVPRFSERPQSLPPTPPESSADPDASQWQFRAVGSDESVKSRDPAKSYFTETTQRTDTFTSYVTETYELSRGDEGEPCVEPHGCHSAEVFPQGEIVTEAQRFGEVDRRLIEELGNVHIGQPAEPKQEIFLATNTERLDVGECKLSEYNWEQSQSFKDFQEDPAHKFWTWDRREQQWFHRDEDTGSMIWCPTELD